MIHLTTGSHTTRTLAIKFTGAEQVKKNASDYEIVQEILTDYELIVDSLNSQRPVEYKEQKSITQQ